MARKTHEFSFWHVALKNMSYDTARALQEFEVPFEDKKSVQILSFKSKYKYPSKEV